MGRPFDPIDLPSSPNWEFLDTAMPAGEGATAVVWRVRATDPEKGGKLGAIKVARAIPGARLALAQEAVLLGRVGRRWGPALLDAGPGFLVTDWVDGVPLDPRDARDRERLAMLVAHGVGRGLEELHQAGVRHGDVKPSNVLRGSRSSSSPSRDAADERGVTLINSRARHRPRKRSSRRNAALCGARAAGSRRCHACRGSLGARHPARGDSRSRCRPRERPAGGGCPHGAPPAASRHAGSRRSSRRRRVGGPARPGWPCVRLGPSGCAPTNASGAWRASTAFAARIWRSGRVTSGPERRCQRPSTSPRTDGCGKPSTLPRGCGRSPAAAHPRRTARAPGPSSRSAACVALAGWSRSSGRARRYGPSQPTSTARAPSSHVPWISRATAIPRPGC